MDSNHRSSVLACLCPLDFSPDIELTFALYPGHSVYHSATTPFLFQFKVLK